MVVTVALHVTTLYNIAPSSSLERCMLLSWIGVRIATVQLDRHPMACVGSSGVAAARCMLRAPLQDNGLRLACC
jgi:hypothetical protein